MPLHRHDTAAKYDASVSKETDDSAEAYADWRAEGPDVRVRTRGR